MGSSLFGMESLSKFRLFPGFFQVYKLLKIFSKIFIKSLDKFINAVYNRTIAKSKTPGEQGVSQRKGVVFMKNTNTIDTVKAVRSNTLQEKAAHKTVRRSGLDRFLENSSDYLANYAVVKGGLSPFQNGFFVA